MDNLGGTTMTDQHASRRLAFDSHEIQHKASGRWLVVKGEAPCLNMQVALEPFYYIERPDYWQIELVGSVPGGVCLEAVQPFEVAVQLDNMLGHNGVELIGRDRSERIDIAATDDRYRVGSADEGFVLLRDGNPVAYLDGEDGDLTLRQPEGAESNAAWECYADCMAKAGNSLGAAKACAEACGI